MENAQRIVKSAAAVAESWFWEVGIPAEVIPALLAEYAKGAPGRDRFMGIAEAWLDSHEWSRKTRQWQEKSLPPFPAPSSPTVAALRAEIEQERSEWIAQGNDRDNVFWAPCRLARWWDTARFIEGVSPPPPMPGPLPGPIDNIQQAIAAADLLLGWCDHAAEPKSEEPVATKAGKRSWRQMDLDAAIGAEIAKYADTIRAARNRSKGARVALDKTLGRNVLARRLGVKAERMVSDSPAWQELADEFGMRRKKGGAAVSRPKKVGLPLAEEAAARDTTAADVIRRETLALLDKEIGNVKHRDKQKETQIRQALADTKDRLVRGEIDDSKAREIAEYTKEQVQDDNSDNVLGSL